MEITRKRNFFFKCLKFRIVGKLFERGSDQFAIFFNCRIIVKIESAFSTQRVQNIIGKFLQTCSIPSKNFEDRCKDFSWILLAYLLAYLFEIDRFKRETRPRVFEARKVNPSTSKLSSLRICRFWKEAISSYAFIVKSDTIGSLLASFRWRHEREIHQLLQATPPR